MTCVSLQFVYIYKLCPTRNGPGSTCPIWKRPLMITSECFMLKLWYAGILIESFANHCISKQDEVEVPSADRSIFSFLFCLYLIILNSFVHNEMPVSIKVVIIFRDNFLLSYYYKYFIDYLHYYCQHLHKTPFITYDRLFITMYHIFTRASSTCLAVVER